MVASDVVQRTPLAGLVFNNNRGTSRGRCKVQYEGGFACTRPCVKRAFVVYSTNLQHMLQEEAALKCLPAKPCTTSLYFLASLFISPFVARLHHLLRRQAATLVDHADGTCIDVSNGVRHLRVCAYWFSRAPTHMK